MRHVALLVVLFAAACQSHPTTTRKSHAFQPRDVHFAPGDHLEISDLSGDSADFTPGANFRVRGHCTLASHERATLYFGLTNGRIEGKNSVEVPRGSGDFDLALHVLPGGEPRVFPHVSLYAGNAPNNCIGSLGFAIVAAAVR